MSDIWFRDGLRRILDSKEQAARRAMQGAELAGYLAALSDLRLEFGLDEPTTAYVVQGEKWVKALT